MRKNAAQTLGAMLTASITAMMESLLAQCGGLAVRITHCNKDVRHVHDTITESVIPEIQDVSMQQNEGNALVLSMGKSLREQMMDMSKDMRTGRSDMDNTLCMMSERLAALEKVVKYQPLVQSMPMAACPTHDVHVVGDKTASIRNLGINVGAACRVIREQNPSLGIIESRDFLYDNIFVRR